MVAIEGCNFIAAGARGCILPLSLILASALASESKPKQLRTSQYSRLARTEDADKHWKLLWLPIFLFPSSSKT